MIEQRSHRAASRPSWLRPARRKPQRLERPWRPVGLRRISTEDLLYVVIDEMVDTAIGLRISPWPWIDSRGRARFPRKGPRAEVGIAQRPFHAFVSTHRRVDGRKPGNYPKQLQRRRLAIGDVFAFRRKPNSPWPPPDDMPPEEWIAPPVWDLTSHARELAKEAFYAAVAPTIGPEESRRFGLRRRPRR
jgi:hypothetical protein